MAEEPAVDSAKKRKLFGFYVAAFALLGSAVAGAFLHKPLTLRYAIYRIRRTQYPNVADQWLTYCTTAACHGNRRAMEVAIDYGYVIPEGHTTSTPTFLLLMMSQPELYFDVLSERDDGDVLARLLGDADANNGGYVRIKSSDTALVAGIVEGQLDVWTRSPESRLSRAAQLGRKFIRRRFAKQLAEAEKQNTKDEK
jgi:hypothetical protein